MTNTHGLNSPTEVFFFSKTPEAYGLPTGYYNYEITRATAHTMDSANAKTRSSTGLRRSSSAVLQWTFKERSTSTSFARMPAATISKK